MENEWTAWMPLLVVLAIAATAAVLIYGIMQMAKAPPATDAGAIAKARRSNKLMQWRILLQLIAVGIFMLMLALR